MDYKNDILNYFEKVKSTIDKLNIEEINDAMGAIYNAYLRSANIYIFGNGGSAATASHFVCDFNKGISYGKEKKFRFLCLNDNIPIMMAISNDISYEEIFRFQLKEVLNKDDLVIGISGSGNSKNVLSAFEYAKEIGATTIAVTGYDGGKLRKIADYFMHVELDDMQITEDIHMIFDHMMMRVFCERI